MSAAPRPSFLNRPMSRAGCLAGLALWLCVMALPCAAVALAMRGELGWARGDFTADRVWLVRAPDEFGRDVTHGLAYSASRVIADDRAAAGPVCVRTRVYFLLWKESEAGANADFCECFQPALNGGFEPAPGAPCPD